MLHNKPRLTYCGLTIIMSNGSRFDTLRLLSANGGQMFDNFCLRPEFNSMMCDIRLMEETAPLLPNTKCLLLLGESAMHKFLPETINNSLNEMRGSLMYHNGIPAIASYNPQDAVDFKAYENTLNPNSKDYTADDSISGDDDEDEGDVKRLGKTKRANYAFWLKRDVWKCKQLLANSSRTSTVVNLREKNSIPTGTVGQKHDVCHSNPTYKIYLSATEVISILTNTKNQWLYFDIETDYEEQNLLCFAFSFDGINIYSVPILNFNYRPAYSDYHFIMRALAIAVRDNTIVAHNGACFDFFVLAHKYHIPINKTYDTMIAQHRCFPDIEKSLGHCVSYWTWEKFHKDEDSLGYRTNEQMMSRLKYCAKDVYTMFLVKQAQDEYARTIPGLSASINAAMSCIRPYLCATLQGVKVDEKKIEEKIKENDRLMFQYNRMIELLIGIKGMEDVRSCLSGKAKMFAGSNKQCAAYFHTLLGYPITDRSKETNEPKLGKLQLYKMALKYENPVITLINAYRGVKKETGRLKFLPWIKTDETNTTFNVVDSKKQTNQSSQPCLTGITV